MAYHWILKPQSILIVPVLLLMLTAVACGSEESTPSPQPTPTPIDVAGIVQQAISAQSGGATPEDVASEIAKAMAAQPGVTSADVAEAIKSALAAQPGVDPEDVAMAIEKALQAQPGISQEEIQKAVEEAVVKALPTAAPSEEVRALSEGAIGYGVFGPRITDFGEPKYGGVIQVHHQFPIRTWNPHGNVINTPQFSPMYNSFLQFNPFTFDRFDIWGDVAEGWEQVDEEGKVWDFKIKPHATWWDGSQVTAEDVSYSLDRMTGRTEDHDTIQFEANRFLKQQYEKSEALDATTVRVHLFAPWGDFVQYMANDHFTFVPKAHYLALDKATAAGDDKFEFDTGIESVMGSGPFKVTKVLDKDNWTYEANPIYWKKDPDGRTLPYVDGMEYHVIQDPTASQAAWEAEQIWVVLWQSSAQMGPGQLKEMVERGNGKFVAYPVPCCPNGILLNTSKPPFDNPLVRRALMLGMDRQNLNAVGWAGEGIIGTTAGAPGHPLTMSAEEIATLPGYRTPKDQDIAAAKALLTEAGYPDGFDTSLIHRTEQGDNELAAAYKQQLKEIFNINLTTIVLDRQGRIEAQAAGNFDMIIAGSGAGVVTPNNSLDLFYRTDAPNNPLNWVYPGPEDLEGLVKEQSRTLDTFERRQIVREIEIITMTKDSHWILAFVKTFSRVFNRDKVAGQMPTQSGYIESKAEHLWLVNP